MLRGASSVRYSDWLLLKRQLNRAIKLTRHDIYATEHQARQKGFQALEATRPEAAGRVGMPNLRPVQAGLPTAEFRIRREPAGEIF